MSKIKKTVAVLVACVLVLILPITASAATYSTNLSAKSEFGYSFTKTTVYCADDTAFLPTQVYINSYGNKDEITFIMSKPVNGTYYFAFSIKMLEDNYNGIEFDMEISDKKYKGQEYDQSIYTVSSGNGSNSYNWFSGWVGSTDLKGKVSDQNYLNSNSTPIESKHYYIQQPSEGNKCNAYDFAFGVEFNSLYYSEVTFVIKNFEFIVPEYDEKNEAQTSGSGASDDLAAAVPDQSAGFTKSLKTFVKAMSTTETECNLKMPAVVIPEIEGLFGKTSLIEEQDINFTQAISLIPPDIMAIVQALTTIALIVFCFKELYNTIEYVLTMRKGGSNE